MIYAGKEVSLFCGHVYVLSVSHGIACDYSRSRAKATRSVTSGFMDLTGAIASSNLADCPRHSRLFGRRTRRGASTSSPPHNARRRRVKSSGLTLHARLIPSSMHVQPTSVKLHCTCRYNYFKVLMRDGTLIQANSADTYQQDMDGYGSRCDVRNRVFQGNYLRPLRRSLCLSFPELNRIVGTQLSTAPSTRCMWM